jgi:hypothetical protein
MTSTEFRSEDIDKAARAFLNKLFDNTGGDEEDCFEYDNIPGEITDPEIVKSFENPEISKDIQKFLNVNQFINICQEDYPMKVAITYSGKKYIDKVP